MTLQSSSPKFSVLQIILSATAVCSMSLATAGSAQTRPSPGLTLTVKPLRGADGNVAAFEVQEEILAPVKDGAPLSLKAALSAITVKHIADSITDLKVTDSTGDIPLTTSDDPPVTTFDSAYRHWQASRPAIFPVSVRYRIPTEPPPEHGPPLGMVASGEGVAGCGIGFLLLPENTTSQLTRMRWDLSGMPTGSVGVITAGNGEVDVPGPPSEMTKQWVLAGPALSVNADHPSGFHGYLVGNPPFDGQKMLQWGDQAYSYLGEWFKYLGLPSYNLFIRAVNGPSFGTGTAGEGRGGSLVTLGNAYWPGQDIADTHNTVFHEMTHQWVGLIQSRYSWFEEGLTTYLSTVLPCEAHLVPLKDCIPNFTSYYTSEGRNWSQQKIDETPFAHEDIRTVPYGRGELYFAALNSQLLAKSNGKRGLKEVLYPLFVARRDGKGFSQADWEAMLNRELGPQAVSDFQAELIQGTKEIIPPSNAFGPCLTRVSVTLKPKDGRAPVPGYEWRPISEGAPASCNTE